MSIITISSDVPCGEAVAEKVATILGYRCVTRQQLIEARRRYGIPETKLLNFLETGPNWWQRSSQSARLYSNVLRATMYETVHEGNVVCYGNTGQDFFAAIPHALNILITAPPDYPVPPTQAEGFDDAQARRHIDHVDKPPRRRLGAVFRIDARAAIRSDLVLNMARMSMQTAIHLIVEAAKQEDYRSIAGSETLLHDLTIAARVYAALSLHPKTKHLDLQVKVINEDVHISGTLHQPDSESEVTQVIQATPGVNKVMSDLRLLWFL
jgi:cytidylate kinase